ncbi:MAG: recombination protein RecR [Planctomycetes bacterium]|nr:recombination protein RecR [Planctomycetota bacterium]
MKDRSAPAGAPGAEAGKAAAPFGASKVLQALVEELEKLPGIGKKTAERLAYHVLRVPAEEAMRLAYAIRDVKKSLRHCRTCFHITESDECEICADPGRDPSTICVVEQPKDVYSIETSGSYKGRYHVLLGAFAPLEGVTPQDLTIEQLLARVRQGGVREVILATNPNFEGDGTALMIREKLRAFPAVRVTRIARGIPSGSQLEHASRSIVSDAVEGRREMGD